MIDNIKQLENFFQTYLKWDKRRIAFLCSFIITLIKVQTINLTKIALGLNPKVTEQSNYRRLQRFFSNFEIELDEICKFLMVLLPIHDNFVLTMDRTNWKFGSVNINILMLGIAYKGIAFPVMWKLLPKRGNSNTAERIELIERFIRIFGLKKIKCLTADREFIGKDWFAYLNNRNIPFCIRIKNNTLTNRNVKVYRLFSMLDIKECYVFPRKRKIHGQKLSIVGVRLLDDYLIIVTNDNPAEAIKNYKKRWEIETLFEALKSRGFNFEDTHLTAEDKICKLIAIMAITFYWVHRVGEWRNEEKPLKVKTHNRLEKSIFRYGLDLLQTILLNISFKKVQFSEVVKLLLRTSENYNVNNFT
jgi:hypothetical protein